MSEIKHTPTPWRWSSDDQGAYIWSFDGSHQVRVAFMGGSDDNQGIVADADFIVSACNAHDDLVAALKQARIALAMMIEPGAIQRSEVLQAYAHCVSAERVARSALAKLEAQS